MSAALTLKPKRRALGTADEEHARRQRIAASLRTLRNARSELRRLGAHQAADHLARAIKSVDGALRHADRCYSDAYYAARRLEGTA